MEPFRYGESKPVVIVTGGNSGIGFHMVERLLQDGFRVVVLDLRLDHLEYHQIKYRKQLLRLRCDLRSTEDVENAVNIVIQTWGQIDVLVNNACLCMFKPFEEKTIEETRDEFEVNYFGAVRMIQAVLPQMKKQGYGIIHNVSSGVGLTGFPGIYGYASTKGALEALTRTLALELKPFNITVNVMHPPLTNTPSASPLGVPAQMMAEPKEVGNRLAGKILSMNHVVTPDAATAVSMFLTIKYPFALGNLLCKMTERQKKENAEAREKGGER